MWNYLLIGLNTAKTVIFSWMMLPLAIWSSFATGGLFRWVASPFRGGLFVKSLESYTADMEGDKIHFLNTAAGDAILLESNGNFALVDAAEDHDNPLNSPDLISDGFENYVTDYVKRVTGGRLNWVMGTHAHSDHIGGFDTLLLDPEITADAAYLKPYIADNKYQYEKDWDNQEVYDQMVNACQTREIPLVQEDLDHREITLGNMKMTIFNGALQPSEKDENVNSMGLLVECNGKRVFLASDINNHSGTENGLSRKIRQVDLLKVGHHGYEGSSTMGFLARLQPNAAVFTNHSKSVHGTVKSRLAIIANSQMMATGDFGGIVAVFGENGINYYAIEEYPSGIGGALLDS